MEITASAAKSAWLDQFVMRLGRLLPSIDPAAASAHAEAIYADAGDLEPEEAAEVFALELPPDDLGAA